MQYLGEHFDIHTGSRELLFPHHENEIAIAKAVAGTSLAEMWMHCEPVHYDGSLGAESMDQITLDTLIDQGWDLKTIRFWLIFGHYRKTLLLSAKALRDARFTLAKINRCLETLMVLSEGPLEKQSAPESSASDMDQLIYDIRQGVLAAMADDLKVSGVILSLLANVKKINRMINHSRIDPEGARRLVACFKDVDRILNLFDFTLPQSCPRDADALIRAREAARRQKDWALADKIREQLKDMGIHLHDKKV
jgi:cysteinyl-tRNA synthetase